MAGTGTASTASTTGQNKTRIKFFKPEIETHDFSDHSLVLPAVSVGNVAQLAVDLLIENLEPRPVKIGRLFHPALEPVIGTDADGKSLLTACELYQSQSKKLIILQFHSPVARRHQNDFINFLVDWIQKSRFEHVICLGSTLASLRNDAQLNEPCAVRYLAGSILDADRLKNVNKLGWKKLEPTEFLDSDTSPGHDVRIPGGGIMKNLFVACETLQISFLALIFFASDGDNTPEAMALFRSANEIYNFIPVGKSGELETELLTPMSWNYSNGGAEPPGLF